MLSDGVTREHFYLLYQMTQDMTNSLDSEKTTIWEIYAQVQWHLPFPSRCSFLCRTFTRAVTLHSGCTSRPLQETFIESKTISMSPRHLYFLETPLMILDAQRRLRTNELLTSLNSPHLFLLTTETLRERIYVCLSLAQSHLGSCPAFTWRKDTV